MSLKSLAQNLAQTAMRTAGDIPSRAAYRQRIGNGAYDPLAGQRAANETLVENLRVVFTDIRTEQQSGVGIADDAEKIALIAARDLGLSPRTNDRIEQADGTNWQVVGVETDPAGALWKIQVKRN